MAGGLTNQQCFWCFRRTKFKDFMSQVRRAGKRGDHEMWETWYMYVVLQFSHFCFAPLVHWFSYFGSLSLTKFPQTFLPSSWPENFLKPSSFPPDQISTNLSSFLLAIFPHTSLPSSWPDFHKCFTLLLTRFPQTFLHPPDHISTTSYPILLTRFPDFPPLPLTRSPQTSLPSLSPDLHKPLFLLSHQISTNFSLFPYLWMGCTQHVHCNYTSNKTERNNNKTEKTKSIYKWWYQPYPRSQI